MWYYQRDMKGKAHNNSGALVTGDNRSTKLSWDHYQVGVTMGNRLGEQSVQPLSPWRLLHMDISQIT